MTHTYKITLNHHFKNAYGIIIFIIGYSLFTLYLIYRYGSEDKIFFISVSVLLFLVTAFIPQLIIHLWFYSLDKRRTLYYTPNKKLFCLKLKNGRQFEFNLDDIEQLERNKSYPLAENRMLWFPWDSYNYSVIRLKNGQQFIVTSLLVLNMDLPIEENKIRLRKRFYPFPFGVKEVTEVKERTNEVR